MIFYDIFTISEEIYIYLELSGEVCCNIRISMGSARYYLSWSCRVKIQLIIQPDNRCMVEYSVSKIFQKDIFFVMCIFILTITFSVKLKKVSRTD